MIFDICQSSIPENAKNVYFVPMCGNTAYDLYDMLNSCFPYNDETYTRNFWEFFLVCFGGYENAIEFVNR